MLMELLANARQRQFEGNVMVSHRCYHSYMKQSLLRNCHFEASILAKGVKLFRSGCVKRIIVDLSSRGDRFKDPMRTHL